MIKAFISLKLNSSNIYVLDSLLKMSIDGVYEVTGRSDYVFLIEAESTEWLNDIIDRIRTMKGVQDTETLIVLNKLEKEEN